MEVLGSAAPVTQNHLSKPEDLMLQNATSLRKSAPGPPNSSDEHVSCTGPATENAFLQIFADPLQMSHACHRFWKCYKPSRFSHVLLTFDKVHNPLRLPRKTTSERPKVLRTPQFFALLTSKCASQRRALFRHLNSQLPKVVRAWCALYILTSKCASRHNSVQFFISHLASWLRTRRFSEPTFRPSGATNLWKNTKFRDFPTFSCTWIFFLLRLSPSSLLFSDSSHLCFSSVHIVGSLTSKLPSIIYVYSGNIRRK